MYFKKSFLILIFILWPLSIHAEYSPISKQNFAELENFNNPLFNNYLINQYLIYNNKIPEKALSKHNAAIHIALMNPKNGVLYAWKYDENKKNKFTGRVRIILSTNDKRGLCRTWLEEVRRNKIKAKTMMATACLDKKKSSYVLIDENFYEKF